MIINSRFLKLLSPILSQPCHFTCGFFLICISFHLPNYNFLRHSKSFFFFFYQSCFMSTAKCFHECYRNKRVAGMWEIVLQGWASQHYKYYSKIPTQNGEFILCCWRQWWQATQQSLIYTITRFCCFAQNYILSNKIFFSWWRIGCILPRFHLWRYCSKKQ